VEKEFDALTADHLSEFFESARVVAVTMRKGEDLYSAHVLSQHLRVVCGPELGKPKIEEKRSHLAVLPSP